MTASHDNLRSMTDATGLFRIVNWADRWMDWKALCLFALAATATNQDWLFLSYAYVRVAAWIAVWARHTVEHEAACLIDDLADDYKDMLDGYQRRMREQYEAHKRMRDDALRLMAAWQRPYRPPSSVDIEAARVLYRQAAKAAHPDRGGSREAWDEVEEAARKLGVSK